MNDTVELFGIPILNSTRTQAVEKIDKLFKHKQQTKIAFANANLINICHNKPSLKYELNNFLLLNDGTGLDIAKKINYGSAFLENLNGTDFIPFYLEATDYKLRIFLYGASETSVEKTKEFINSKYAEKHIIVGQIHGYTNKTDSDIVNEINHVSPDLILVALGNPIQETWIARNLEKTNATLAFGVGALFDFMSGETNRAPEVLRKIKSEWIYRLYKEPRRLFKRYIIGNPLFIYRAISEKYQKATK
ncbi:WecB/TagA/CpsF family glycosyltransferase [Pseudomonas sp. MPC6]|uniref:WecB/TagA/CpsF family glycosyltransferase n=1 Tax=unclassified Pseudomonas TaxID=196821 RepID=UPI0011106F27|nr:WecB/TagA/CpsF family glycosyltransferase [Pseudomonas sp. MPC6]QCY11377.1 WecB/TagA/CpsF family glycosyltransferase [Pseudomonas sp. MPC6]